MTNIIVPTPAVIPVTETITEVPRKFDDRKPGQVLFNNGILFMDKEFNQENCMPLVKSILEYNMLPESEQPDEIKLYINSPGGAVHSAFHLIDTIKMSRIPVSTISMGMAASCGVLLLMTGVKGRRFITQNTSVMSHQYAWGSKGKEHELYGIVKEFEMSSARMIDHYKKCTGKTEKYIRKHLLPETDQWLSPEEVIKHGIADHIITTY
jgi:ATP-dependent Clp endopeptidase proteolytic subunit ClpP